MIVWLASFPRSGNSFFRDFCRINYGIEIYSIYPEKRFYANPDDITRMQLSDDIYLVKTHDLPTDDRPAIYLVRDGRDALVSLTWYDLSVDKTTDEQISRDVFDASLEEHILSPNFGGWSANALAWSSRPEKTDVLRFEDWINKPEEVLPGVLEGMGFQIKKNANSVLDFEKLHKQNPRLYRKGKIGGWKADMSEALHDLLWQHHGEAMRAFRYER